MNVVPLNIARVSTQLKSSLLGNTMQGSTLDLLKVQQQLSTGQRLTSISDDAAAALGIERLQRQVDANGQYTKNLTFAAGFLDTADAALGSLNDLITQAQTIANAQASTTTTSDERASQAAVVDSLISGALALANRRYQNQPLFGGQNSVQDPFVAVGGGYMYQGSTVPQAFLTDTGEAVNFSVNGNQVFGGMSSQVVGYQDLTPALSAATRLADISGATGTTPTTGSVQITAGATTVTVDLSAAATVGDVTTLVNNALTANGINATLSTSGRQFVLTNSDTSTPVALTDINSGSTLSTLGIPTSAAASTSVNGTTISPRLTGQTQLADLAGGSGAGFDTNGIVISNGANSATVSLTGLSTVQDLLNAINGSGTHVTAAVNDAGTGINLFNALSGTELRIGENGGNTADQLGLRSFQATTQLADFNAGTGITPISGTLPGPSGNITIADTAGATFNVDVSGVKTTSDLIAAINGATGNTTITASANASGNGITLTSSGGGTIAVSQAQGFVSNGSQLGIFGSGTGSLTGSDITFSTDDFRVTRQDGSSFTVNLTGATSVQDVLDAINNADGNAAGASHVTAALNSTGNGISLTDPTAGSGRLTVTATNASQVAQQLGISKTAAAGTPGTINGDDANPLQPTGVFSSLALLRDSLQKNDTAGIIRAAQLLASDGKRVVAAQGVVGARGKDISARQDQAASDATQLKSSLSVLQDTDYTTTITKYQLLQTAYQAALQVAQTTQNTSLLDFLK